VSPITQNARPIPPKGRWTFVNQTQAIAKRQVTITDKPRNAAYKYCEARKEISMNVWLLGILAAFISGGASGVVAGVTATGIDPASFNWTTQLKNTFILMGIVFVISGALGVAAYLKQSPLPRDVWTPQDRAKRTGNPMPTPPARLVWTQEERAKRLGTSSAAA
jgi:hypothetical protein